MGFLRSIGTNAPLLSLIPVLAACGGTLPSAATSPGWGTGKGIYLDTNATNISAVDGVPGVIQGVRTHLTDDLRAAGLNVSDFPDHDKPVIRVKSLARSAVEAELLLDGTAIETFKVDVSDCTSWAWGVVADANEQCLARGLSTQLVASSKLRAALKGATPQAKPAVAARAEAAPTPGGPPTAPIPASPRAEGASGALVPGSPQPTAYAVIVGIEHYDGLPPPTGARDDALRFADLVRKSLGVAESHLRVALDEKATKASIERNLEWVRTSVPPGGRVYFYFSGHGAPDASAGTAYILPVDGDPKYLTQTAIPIADVLKQLGESKAKETLAVIDSCFSGAGGRSVLPPGARPLVRVKNDSVKGQIAVFSAASGPETSGPTSDGTGGLFTHYLLQGLGQAAADTDGDGQISLEELAAWVKPRVAREAKKDNRDQTPSLVLGSGLGTPSSFVVAWGLSTK